MRWLQYGLSWLALSLAIASAAAAPWLLHATSNALGLSWLVLLLGAGAVQLSRADAASLRVALATLLACTATLAPTLWLLAVALVLIGLLLSRTLWQRAGALLQAAALLTLGWQAHAWHWTAPVVGAIISPWQIAALLAGACLSLGALPGWPQTRHPPPPLLATLTLLPLLHLYQLGPLDWRWGLLAALIGGWSALAQAVAALRATTAHAADSAVLLAWWSAALTPVLLATEPAVAAVWTLALVALLVAGSQSAALSTPGRALVLGALPPGLAFAGLWLLAAAGLAGGLPLLAGLAMALLPLLTLASLAWPVAAPQLRAHWLLLLTLILGATLPLLLNRLVRPALQQLGAGMTPFGQLQIWPWLGLSVRTSGAQTVATLPGMIVITLLLVCAALAWLFARRRAPASTAPPALTWPELWRAVRQRLPGATADPSSSEQDHDA